MPYAAGTAPGLRIKNISRSITSLGDYPPAYAAWVASVKNAGGIVTSLPRGEVKNWPVAKYAMQQWVPLVNARKWPAPDEYSRDGQWGYYFAPADVANVAGELVKPKGSEVPSMAWSDALSEAIRKAAFPAVIGAGALWFVTQMLNPRGNPPRRRRRR